MKKHHKRDVISRARMAFNRAGILPFETEGAVNSRTQSQVNRTFNLPTTPRSDLPKSPIVIEVDNIGPSQLVVSPRVQLEEVYRERDRWRKRLSRGARGLSKSRNV